MGTELGMGIEVKGIREKKKEPPIAKHCQVSMKLFSVKNFQYEDC